MELWVEWTVLCEFGPNWVGSCRKIQFYLDDRPLAPSPLQADLEQRLIDVLGIPETSKDAVITGEAKDQRTPGVIELIYSWQAAIPYADPHDSQHGTIMLLLLP